LPAAGGTCAASQFALGKAISDYGFGTITTSVVFVTLPLRNVGATCLLALPMLIGVASSTGALKPVSAEVLSAPPIHVQAGQALSMDLRAEWWNGIGSNPDTGSPIPAPPCTDPISAVTRIVIPLASGGVRLDLDPIWRLVCTSPASVALSISTP
jgi:hypothetical protein